MTPTIPLTLVWNTFFAGIFFTVGLLCLYAFIRDREQKDFLWLGLHIWFSPMLGTIARKIVPNFIRVQTGYDEIFLSIVTLSSIFIFIFIISAYRLQNPWRLILNIAIGLMLLIAIGGLLSQLINHPINNFNKILNSYFMIVSIATLVIVIVSLIRNSELRTFRAGVVSIGLVGGLIIAIIVNFLNARLPDNAKISNIQNVFFILFVGIGMMHDLARLQKEQRLELDKLNAERSDYFSFALHNLRIPLTLVCAKIEALCKLTREMLIKRIEDDEVRLDDVYLSLRKMLKETSEVLADARDLPIDEMFDHSVTVDLIPFLKRKAELFNSLSQKVELKTRFEGENLYIRIDPEALNQVVDNLLANAAEQMTQNNPLKLPLLLSASSDGDKVSFAVVDNGPGLSEKEIQRIFKQKWIQRNIGLPFIRKVVESAEGELSLTRPSDHDGLEARVTLPQRKLKRWDEPVGDLLVDTPPVGRIEPVAHPQQADLPMLYIIDDNQDLREYLGVGLCDEYQIRSFSSAEEAMQALGLTGGEPPVVDAPTVVLTDYYLGEGKMSGIDFIRRLIDNGFEMTPTILMSQYLTENNANLLIDSLMIEYARKPLSLRQLRVSLRRFCTISIELRRLEEKDPMLDHIPERFRQMWKMRLKEDEEKE